MNKTTTSPLFGPQSQAAHAAATAHLMHGNQMMGMDASGLKSPASRAFAALAKESMRVDDGTSFKLSHNESNSSDEVGSVDLLMDERFRVRTTWFTDVAFALKPYPHGALLGLPSYCTPESIVERNVVKMVEEAEAAHEEADSDLDEEVETSRFAAQANSQVETQTALALFRRLSYNPRMWAMRLLGFILSKVWRAAFTHVHIRNASTAVDVVKHVRELSSRVRHPSAASTSSSTSTNASSKTSPLLNGPLFLNGSSLTTTTTTTTNPNEPTPHRHEQHLDPEDEPHRPTALIILPTHRSHADYLLMSYVFFGFNLPLPLIAAGDNLNVPIVGPFLARGGAFFIKRTQGTPRYRRVLHAFLGEVLQSDAPMEFFVEGGRSRRGYIGKPKVGLLGMVIDLVRTGHLHDALLLPSSIDYDEVPEAVGYASEVLGASKKKPESLMGTIRAIVEWLLWGKRSGSVYVSFADKPVSVRAVLERIAEAEAEDAVKFGIKPRAGSFSPQLGSANRKLPQEMPIFRGSSIMSLADGSDEHMAHLRIATEICELVTDAQRKCALVTWGGVAAVALLMQRVQDETVDAVLDRVEWVVRALVEQGLENRMPPGMSARGADMRAEAASVIQTITRSAKKGPAEVRKDARLRLCLRYSCASLVLRLLPVCMAAFASAKHAPSPTELTELNAWLAASFDCDAVRVPASRAVSMEVVRAVEWTLLMGPTIEVLSAVLADAATWRYDSLIPEDQAVQQVRGSLSSRCDFPESTGPLEIVAGLRTATTREVLARKPVPSTAKVSGYELTSSASVRLPLARRALDSARKVVNETMAR